MNKNDLLNPGTVVHAYDPNTWEVETERPEVGDDPWIYNESEASMECVRLSKIMGVGLGMWLICRVLT